MWNYFKIELMQFFLSKKNFAVYVVFMMGIVFFSFRLAPDYDPIEKIDEEEIQARYDSRNAFLAESQFSSNPMVYYARSIFETINPLDGERLRALKEEDWATYAAKTASWYEETNWITQGSSDFFYNPRYYSYGNAFAEMDGFYGYSAASVTMHAYAEADYALSRNVLDGRTAWQTLERLWMNYLPYILLATGLFLIVDIITKDRHNPTVLRGFPIANWKRMVVKMGVAYMGVAALWLPIMIGFLFVGLQFGFGSLHMPVTTYELLPKDEMIHHFSTMTLRQFFTQVLFLHFLWVSALIGLVFLVSVLVYQEMLTIVLGLLFIFAEFIYFSRAAGKLWDVQQLPFTYSQVGQIVTGMRKFYYETPLVEYATGCYLVGGCAIVAFAFTFLCMLNRRFALIR